MEEMNIKSIIEKSLKDNKYINKDIIEGNKEALVFKDFISTTDEDLDFFEEQSWKKGDGYKAPGFPMVTEALEGLDEGLYLVAGESNSGKTAWMMNLVHDLCIHSDNKLFGIYYTLDDTKNDVIPRIVAMTESIPIGVVAKPQRYQNLIDAGEENSIVYQTYLNQRTEGLNKLRTNKNHFKIEDGSVIKSAEDMFAHMKQLQLYIKSIDPEMNIIVAIDSVDDIRFATQHFGNTTDKHAAVARTIKEWSTELHIPIFGSRHLKKLGKTNRPTLDDLKDSNEYVYEASVVFLVHNDVSKNKQGATVFYQTNECPEKLPVLEIDWAKNKKSSFKGRTFCYFIPNFSKMTECGENEAKRFNQLVYGSVA